jgi:hypothetical protein
MKKYIKLVLLRLFLFLEMPVFHIGLGLIIFTINVPIHIFTGKMLASVLCEYQTRFEKYVANQ